jgi:hypothetical protein
MFFFPSLLITFHKKDGFTRLRVYELALLFAIDGFHEVAGVRIGAAICYRWFLSFSCTIQLQLIDADYELLKLLVGATPFRYNIGHYPR